MHVIIAGLSFYCQRILGTTIYCTGGLAARLYHSRVFQSTLWHKYFSCQIRIYKPSSVSNNILRFYISRLFVWLQPWKKSC